MLASTVSLVRIPITKPKPLHVPLVMVESGLAANQSLVQNAR
jgi:hypothetical protein